MFVMAIHHRKETSSSPAQAVLLNKETKESMERWRKQAEKEKESQEDIKEEKMEKAASLSKKAAK